MTDIAENLVEMFRRMEQADPLLRRGIMRDWVCVINPQLVYFLEDFYKENYADQALYSLSQDARLRTVTGRDTYIDSRAPLDVQYMTVEVYQRLFPPMKPMEDTDGSASDAAHT